MKNSSKLSKDLEARRCALLDAMHAKVMARIYVEDMKSLCSKKVI